MSANELQLVDHAKVLDNAVDTDPVFRTALYAIAEQLETSQKMALERSLSQWLAWLDENGLDSTTVQSHAAPFLSLIDPETRSSITGDTTTSELVSHLQESPSILRLILDVIDRGADIQNTLYTNAGGVGQQNQLSRPSVSRNLGLDRSKLSIREAAAELADGGLDASNRAVLPEQGIADRISTAREGRYITNEDGLNQRAASAAGLNDRGLEPRRNDRPSGSEIDARAEQRETTPGDLGADGKPGDSLRLPDEDIERINKSLDEIGPSLSRSLRESIDAIELLGDTNDRRALQFELRKLQDQYIAREERRREKEEIAGEILSDVDHAEKRGIRTNELLDFLSAVEIARRAIEDYENRQIILYDTQSKDQRTIDTLKDLLNGIRYTDISAQVIADRISTDREGRYITNQDGLNQRDANAGGLDDRGLELRRAEVSADRANLDAQKMRLEVDRRTEIGGRPGTEDPKVRVRDDLQSTPDRAIDGQAAADRISTDREGRYITNQDGLNQRDANAGGLDDRGLEPRRDDRPTSSQANTNADRPVADFLRDESEKREEKEAMRRETTELIGRADQSLSELGRTVTISLRDALQAIDSAKDTDAYRAFHDELRKLQMQHIAREERREERADVENLVFSAERRAAEWKRRQQRREEIAETSEQLAILVNVNRDERKKRDQQREEIDTTLDDLMATVDRTRNEVRRVRELDRQMESVLTAVKRLDNDLLNEVGPRLTNLINEALKTLALDALRDTPEGREFAAELLDLQRMIRTSRIPDLFAISELTREMDPTHNMQSVLNALRDYDIRRLALNEPQSDGPRFVDELKRSLEELLAF